MVTIEKVDETNKQRVINSIKQDVIKHVFAFYDIQHDPEHTSVYAASENGKLTGYILTYTATDVSSVILEGESDAASQLRVCTSNPVHYSRPAQSLANHKAEIYKRETLRRGLDAGQKERSQLYQVPSCA